MQVRKTSAAGRAASGARSTTDEADRRGTPSVRRRPPDDERPVTQSHFVHSFVDLSGVPSFRGVLRSANTISDELQVNRRAEVDRLPTCVGALNDLLPLNELWLAVVAFGAALVNGAVGYGFSSIVTPLALLWFSNKILNPALVIVEVTVNLALLTRERRYIRATWPRARPVVLTLLPGVLLGTGGLTYLAVNEVKLIVYAVLLPLASLQLLGFSRPLENERRGGAVIGVGIGFLYSLTTISGPPLAMFLRNQGFTKNEFRCTIAQIRVAESTLTLGTYLAFDQFLGAGLVQLPSLTLLPFLFGAVLVGVPLGTLVLGSVSPEFFRRFVMAIDGMVVSYGLSRVLSSLKWLSNAASDYVLGALVLLIGALAWFALRQLPVWAIGEPPPGQPPTQTSGGPSTPARERPQEPLT